MAHHQKDREAEKQHHAGNSGKEAIRTGDYFFHITARALAGT